MTLRGKEGIYVATEKTYKRASPGRALRGGTRVRGLVGAVEVRIKMEQLDGQERPRVWCAVHVDSKGRRVEPQPKVTQRTVRNLRRRFGKPQKFFGAGS